VAQVGDDLSSASQQGHTGHVGDNTGLVYMQARYYDPVIGRFYSNDPLGYRGVHSFNRYAYANNNPYKYIDPDGREATRIGQRLDLRVQRLGSGEITAQQYKEENIAEAVGGAVGGALVASGALTARAIVNVLGSSKVVKTTVSKTKNGGPRIKQTRKDGSQSDITDERVKEYKPNNHPNAPKGTMQKVEFENPQPGSKGYKRDPSPKEKKLLDNARGN